MTILHNSIEYTLIPLDGNNQYFISKSGTVLNHYTDNLLFGSPNKDGYIQTAITVNKKSTLHRAHRLVAITHITNPENKPLVNHKDGVKANNNVSNLEWCTSSENILHAYRTGLKSNKGELHPMNKVTEKQVLEIRHIFSLGGRSRASISREFNVSKSLVERIISRKTWSHI